MTNTDMLLIALGFFPSYKGFFQLSEAIDMAASDIPCTHNLTTHIYPTIARKYNTTAAAVERNIRTAINAACDNYYDTALRRALKVNKNAIPSNKTVIHYAQALLKDNQSLDNVNDSLNNIRSIKDAFLGKTDSTNTKQSVPKSASNIAK